MLEFHHSDHTITSTVFHKPQTQHAAQHPAIVEIQLSCVANLKEIQSVNWALLTTLVWQQDVEDEREQLKKNHF